MRLHKRPSQVIVSSDREPPAAPFSRLTQLLYLVVLALVVFYLGHLAWSKIVRLELRGVVVMDSIEVAAPREGQITMLVSENDWVEKGDTLAKIDPQLGCIPGFVDNSHLEKARHELRLAGERERLARFEIRELKRLQPTSDVRRALELDGTRGESLLDWQLRLQRASSDLKLASATRQSLEQRQAEILAQASLASKLAAHCLSQSVVATFSGQVLATFHQDGEFSERGETILLLRKKDSAVFVEVFPSGEDLPSLTPGKSVNITLPDGSSEKASVAEVGAAAADLPRMETDAYIPLDNALRARIVPADAASAERWRPFERMDVEVRLQR